MQRRLEQPGSGVYPRTLGVVVAIMGEFDLLSTVQPEHGWYAVVGIKGDSRQQELVETREELDNWVYHFHKQKRNVFFGVAKYKDGTSRAKHNVQALKCFWLDIDCGPGKDYPSQTEGLTALREFCKGVGLPKPTVVNSGRGLHVYWALDNDITREMWELVAARLKQVCATQGLHVDNTCFEVARILRVPDTHNYKGTDPVPVVVIAVGKPTSCETLRDLLGVKDLPPITLTTERRVSALGQLLQSNIESNFARIMQRGDDGCRQLISCYTERASLSEPRWFDALSVAKFCTDRDRAVHKLSSDHPDYDPAAVEQKLKHIVGPHTCGVFESNNPNGCDGCPHKGNIKSPILLGKRVKKATEEDNVVEDKSDDGTVKSYRIPDYPFPYFRGANGGIYRKGEGEEAKDELVYPYDLYIVKRMRDPVEGGVILLRSHSPMDGVEEFTLPTRIIGEPAEIRKELARRDILGTPKENVMLVDFVIRSFKGLRHRNKAEQMRNQFGWADGDSKFIIGDREVGVEGTFHSPPSSITMSMSEHLTVVGSFAKWREVFDLYGREGLEAHAFAAATAFGAPLLKFSGQRGAIINIIHPNSGTGKTTMLHMCNSVWGDPVKLCAKKDDTHNSKVFKLGVLCNLPICFDEMTNTKAEHLSELAYLIAHGNGKDRMKSSANELRNNLTSWQTIALCSSNTSFYDKLETLKDRPQGETMRIIEYYLDYSDAIDTQLGKEMFDHQLLENYGHAGEIYARYLLAEYDEVKAIYKRIQFKLDTHLKLTQSERFWSATVAANLTGIHIAKRLNLCDWDLSRIFKWACKMILNLRNTTKPPLDSEHQTLGEFILNHIDNILIVKEGVDRRTKMQELPLLEPKRELLIRYEPDTSRVFVVSSAFRRYCTNHGINYRDTIGKMKKVGMYLDASNKRMTKGMKLNVPGVHALEFDARHPDFGALADLASSAEGAEVAATEE